VRLFVEKSFWRDAENCRRDARAPTLQNRAARQKTLFDRNLPREYSAAMEHQFGHLRLTNL